LPDVAASVNWIVLLRTTALLTGSSSCPFEREQAALSTVRNWYVTLCNRGAIEYTINVDS